VTEMLTAKNKYNLTHYLNLLTEMENVNDELILICLKPTKYNTIFQNKSITSAFYPI